MKRIKLLITVILNFLIIDGMAQPVWTQKTDYTGGPRYNFAGFSLNGKGYIGGGRFGGPFNSQDDWQKFNPVSNAWISSAVMPYPFTALSAFEIGGFGYVANGVNDAFYNYDSFKYNSAGNNWSTVGSLIYPRLYSASCATGTDGYVIGGYGFMAEPLNDIWKYDPIMDTWTEMDTLPLAAARYDATAFSLNDKVYLFGGVNDVQYFNDLWEFDPSLNVWTQKSPMPSQERMYCMSFVINNEAYIVGGMSGSGSNLKEVWKYNGVTDSWLQLPNFPGTNAPFGGIGFSINGKGYIACGNGTNECWEFDPGSVGVNEISTQNVWIAPNPVIDHAVIYVPSNENYTLQIYNNLGQLINSLTSNDSSIAIDKKDFNSGIYFVKLFIKNQELKTMKFIVK